MTTTKDALPELPEAFDTIIGLQGDGDEAEPVEWPVFTIDQMRAYALAALASRQAPADLREIECPPDPDVVDRALSERPRLSPYDAVARAMDLASLLAGSVGMNNKEQANAYSSRLRRHLIEYVYPATSAEAQAKSEPAASDARDAARYRWLRDNTDSDWAICEWNTDESDGIGYYRDARAPNIVDAEIDAAIAATQEQKP